MIRTRKPGLLVVIALASILVAGVADAKSKKQRAPKADEVTEALEGLACEGPKPRVAVYRLSDPAAGSNTVAVTLANGNSDKCAIGAISYTSVDQTTPIAVATGSSGNNTAPSVSVNSQTNDMVQGVMASIADGAPTLVPLDPRYVIEMGGAGNSSHFAVASTKSGASPVTMSWTLTEEKEWVAIGININAVGP